MLSLNDKNLIAEALQRADSFDMLRVVRRFAREHEISDDFAVEHERELKRFFAITIVDPPGYAMPLCLVDELWHWLILDTHLYRKFCHQVVGAFVDHVEGTGSQGRGSYDSFLADYQGFFGTAAPQKLWPNAFPDPYTCDIRKKKTFLRRLARQEDPFASDFTYLIEPSVFIVDPSELSLFDVVAEPSDSGDCTS